MKQILIFLIILRFCNICHAQDTVFDSLVAENFTIFKPTKSKSFTGNGWDFLTREINQANSVLLGETHFTNEIPYFTNALVNNFTFSNYFLEVDPYSVKIIEDKIKNLSTNSLNKFINDYNSNFSFLELKPEFELFKTIVNKRITPFGIEQINSDADRLIISDLLRKTKNENAKMIFEKMLKASNALHLENKGKKYLFTEECLQELDQLLTLNITTNEKKEIEDLKLSRQIYLKSNHLLRIDLMKYLIMDNYSNLIGGKNLFKFGAVHLSRRETLLTKYSIYDIGNLVANIEAANFRKSLHIILIGKNDRQSEEDDLPKSFLKVMNDKDWFCFDLRPLKNALTINKLKIENSSLQRIINGYDLVIYIPKLTESRKNIK